MTRLIYLSLKAFFRALEYGRGIRLAFFILICGGQCKGIPKVGKAVTWKYPPHSGIAIGSRCDIGPGCLIDAPPTAQLTIGANVKLTAGIIISCANHVEIGDDTLIAEYSCIRDSQHKYFSDHLIRAQPLQLGTITIGKDVWIGRASSILLNTHLADGCVIGAQSLLKNYRTEPNSVYVGNPARIIKMRVPHQCDEFTES
jgi:acetyltransferase-like isoleucine patch superfamily enzyme